MLSTADILIDVRVVCVDLKLSSAGSELERDEVSLEMT